jgi:outer membrane biosynthesis protein TonB
MDRLIHVDRAPIHSPIHVNKAVRDSHYWNCNSSDKATTMQSPSRVSKFKFEQSSPSKRTSKASDRTGKEYSTEAPQEKEKRPLHETPEEKKKRREEHKAKKEHTEKKKSRKEGELSETPEEKKKRKEERKEKKQKKIEKKETKEKVSKTKSVPAATENMSCESPGGRSSQTASTIMRNGFGGVVGRRGNVCSRRSAILSC